ncbi:unnamed protein product [Brugia pahangi]|uniref:PDZ domain-containing protein n=1 Tax=Brugia pahangi TaxID=6280 RepID=A0A0N4TWE1_BRUPA|nr:unnamed protein product [Brugia pahangi]
MCLCSRKKSEVRLETQPPVSILQRSPALGVEPNSALIDRIHSFKEPAKDLSIKKGDLIFSLKELKKVPKASGNNKYGSKQNVRVQKCELDADDDTLYPKPISISKNEADQDEVDDEVSTETPECDPYAPLEELEKREGFNCQTLRKNTFLANAFTAEEGSERTQTDSELELVETQDILPLSSNETLERSPKRKTFPKILWETSSTIKSATINSADSVDQSSKPEAFTKTEISSISSHKKEIFRNNPELRLETDLKKKDKNDRNSVIFND